MRKLSDKKRLVILICIFAAFAMIIASAGVLSKWLIVPTVSAEPKFVVEADSSDLFTQEATYNGEDNIPELTPEGKLVFGECEFTITWNGGNYRSKVNGNEGIPKSEAAHDNGNYAGEHFFTIIDNTTGQIISSNHRLVVKPKEVTVAPIESEIYFVGNTLKVEKLSLVGFVDDYKCDYPIEKRTVEASDYGAITASSVTASEKAYTVTVPQNHNLGGDEKNNNYCIPEGGLSYSIPFTVLPTCYSGSDSSTTYTYYGTLVAALNATQSADSPVNVIPMQSFVYTPTGGSQTTYTSGIHYNHMIDEDCIVGSAVTLNIPYTADTTDAGFADGLLETHSKLQTEEAYQKTLQLKNNVEIFTGKKLTNNGKIIIAGVVSGGQQASYYNSITSGTYSQITLCDDSKLENIGGAIDCYGFIREETDDNGSEVILSSGILTSVFSITEHRGGGAYLGMTDITGEILSDRLEDSISFSDILAGKPCTSEITPGLVCFPFNRFYIQSVSPKMTVSNGASVNGYVNLYANSQDNVTTINLIGNSGTSLIRFSESTSKIVHKYDPKTRKHDLDVYGSATVNPLKLVLTVQESAASVTIIITVNLTTSDILFPLSHHWDISFNKSDNSGNQNNVNISNQKIKILPGASLTIGDGVFVNADEIAVYSNNELLNLNLSKTYTSAYADNTSGILKVNGSLTVNMLGGFVHLGSTSAKLKVTSSNTVVSPELYTTESSEFNVSVWGIVSKKMSYQEATFTTDTKCTISGTAVDSSYNTKSNHLATGDIYNGSEIIPNSNLSANYQYNGYYGGSSYAWGGYRTLVLSYVSNGGSSVANKTVGYWDGSCVLLEGSDLLPIPTRDNCRFEGWYTDSALTQPAEGLPITANTTLYAKWSAVLSFQYVYRDFETPPTLTPPGDITFYTHDTAVPIPTPTEDYIFLGWYIDSGCSADKKLDVTTLSVAEILNLTSADGKYVLYGLWSNAKYEITFDQSTDRYGELTQYSYTLSPGTLTNKLPTISPGHRSDAEKQYYFSHWVYVDSNGAEKRINTDDYSFISDTGLNEVTIKAVWIEKAHTITYVSEGSNNGEMRYYEGGDVATLLSTESVGWSFKGWYTATSEGTKIGDAEATYTPTEESITLYAQWDKYVVSFNANGGSCDPESAICDGKPLMLPTPTRTGYKFLGWYTAASGGNKIGDAGASYTPTANVTLYAQWAGFVVTYDANGGNCDTESQTYAGEALILPLASRNSYTFNGWYTAKSGGTKIGDAGASYTPTSDITLYAQWSWSCIVEGTLITLADGTHKKVEDLTYDDILLVLNPETGEFEAGRLALNAHADVPATMTRIINLLFSNGEILRISYNHLLFDATLNKYVLIDEENAAGYIGHEFYSASYDGSKFVGENIVLVDAFITEEIVRVFAPVSAEHANTFANGIMNAPGARPGVKIAEWVNVFEFDENMRYDPVKKQADIEKYGLYTYEEFADYVSEDIFYGLHLDLLKVSVGRGDMTLDDIMEIINEVTTHAPGPVN